LDLTQRSPAARQQGRESRAENREGEGFEQERHATSGNDRLASQTMAREARKKPAMIGLRRMNEAKMQRQVGR